MNTKNFIDILSEELTEDFIAESLIVEALSNWEYEPPKDPEKILYDFYFFTLFADKVKTRDKKFNFALEEAVEKATNSLQKHMTKAIKFSISSELRHLFDSTYGNIIYRINDNGFEPSKESKMNKKTKEFITELKPRLKYFEPDEKKSKRSKFVPKNIHKKRMTGPIKGERKAGERTDAFKAVYATQKKLGMSNYELSKVAKEIFNEANWYNDYGGKAWGDIAESWSKIITSKTTKEKIKWIDHAYDLQHNTDTVFNKLKSYYRAGSGYEWLNRALDWKKDVKDVRGYYKKVSPPLKRVVAYAAKNIYGKSMEGFTDETPDKIWEIGTWPGGIWHNGQWRNGTFQNGTWEAGTWKDGIWNNGIWKGGIWENGHWKDGTWKDGTWKRGRWESGTWQNGRWEYGEWMDGRWKDGTWINGKWRVGRIWSKKYNKWVKSNFDPYIFEQLEKETKTIKELQGISIDD